MRFCDLPIEARLVGMKLRASTYPRDLRIGTILKVFPDGSADTTWAASPTLPAYPRHVIPRYCECEVLTNEEVEALELK